MRATLLLIGVACLALLLALGYRLFHARQSAQQLPLPTAAWSAAAPGANARQVEVYVDRDGRAALGGYPAQSGAGETNAALDALKGDPAVTAALRVRPETPFAALRPVLAQLKAAGFERFRFDVRSERNGAIGGIAFQPLDAFTPEESLFVAISPTTVHVRDQDFDFYSLDAVFRGLAEEDRRTKILVNVEPAVSCQQLIGVLELCAHAGLSNVNLWIRAAR